MPDIADMLQQARAHALGDGLPTRRKDAALYKLLAECLAICELADRDRLHAELREAVRVSPNMRNPEIWGNGRAAGNNGKGRRFAFKDADAYTLVARYVLDGKDTRHSIYRYAAALRGAGLRQISSAQLPQWLKENGGVKTLAPGYYGASATLFDQACGRIFDMLLGDDGEAFFQAERFLKEHRPDLYNKIGMKNG